MFKATKDVKQAFKVLAGADWIDFESHAIVVASIL